MTELVLDALQLNPMHMIGEDWWLVTAGTLEGGFNTMTAAWGQMGALWGRRNQNGILSVATVYVRPQRYTKAFLDREAFFTLSVLKEGNKKALAYLGAHSGRDGDKVKASGLTPIELSGSVAFKEAALVFLCRKLYHAPLVEEGFADRSLIDDNYPERDYHEMYVGEIVKAFSNV